MCSDKRSASASSEAAHCCGLLSAGGLDPDLTLKLLMVGSVFALAT